MREAVVHIAVDPHSMSSEVVEQGWERLEDDAVTLHRRIDDRVYELVVPAADPDQARRRASAAWERAHGLTPTITAVTFISRGTDEDALGVLAAFGLQATVDRTEEEGNEVVVVTIPAADQRRAPEARLQTALEAALNCEVRLHFG